MRTRGIAREFAALAVGHSGDECVVWPWVLNTSGYGYFYEGKKSILAHRWVCARTHGEPSPGMESAHSCGNRSCINPRHLSWKTKKGNAADRLLHGTHHRGTHSPRAKLDWDRVAAIRASTKSAKELAKEHGVCERHIDRVRSGVRWTDEQEEAA